LQDRSTRMATNIPGRPTVSESFLAGRVDKLEDMVWRGNGDSLVTQVRLIKKDQDDIRDSMNRWERIATRFLYGTGSLAVAVFSKLIYDFLVTHFH
jgi:hypothetical protein